MRQKKQVLKEMISAIILTAKKLILFNLEMKIKNIKKELKNLDQKLLKIPKYLKN